MEEFDSVFGRDHRVEWKPPPPSIDGASSISGFSRAGDVVSFEHDRPWSTATRVKRGPTGKTKAIWDEKPPPNRHRVTRSTTIKDGECRRIIGEFRKLCQLAATSFPNQNENVKTSNTSISVAIDMTNADAFCRLCVRAIAALRGGNVNMDHIHSNNKLKQSVEDGSLRVTVRDLCMSVLRLLHIDALNVTSSRREELQKKHYELAKQLCARYLSISVQDAMVVQSILELVNVVREFMLSQGRTILTTSAFSNNPSDDISEKEVKLSCFIKCVRATCIKSLQQVSAPIESDEYDISSLRNVVDTARTQNALTQFAMSRQLIPITSSAPLNDIVQRINVRKEWGQLSNEDKENETTNWENIFDAITIQSRLDNLITSVEAVLGVQRSWFVPEYQTFIIRIQAAWRTAVIKTRMPKAQRQKLRKREEAIRDGPIDTEADNETNEYEHGRMTTFTSLATIPPPPTDNNMKPLLFDNLLPRPRPPGAEAIVLSANAVFGLLQPTLNERFEGYAKFVWQILSTTRSWVVSQLLNENQTLHHFLSNAKLCVECVRDERNKKAKQSSPSSFNPRNTNVVGRSATYVGDAQVRTSKLKAFLEKHCPVLSTHECTVLLVFLDRQRNGCIPLRDLERFILGSYTTASLALALSCFNGYEATDLTGVDGTSLRVKALLCFFETYAPAQAAHNRVLFVHAKYKDDAETNRELFRQLFKKYAPKVSLQDADRFWIVNCGSGISNNVVQVLNNNKKKYKNSDNNNSNSNSLTSASSAKTNIVNKRTTRTWKRQRFASLQLVSNILKLRSTASSRVSGGLTRAIRYMGWDDLCTAGTKIQRLLSLPEWLQFCAELCAMLSDGDSEFDTVIEQLNELAPSQRESDMKTNDNDKDSDNNNNSMSESADRVDDNVLLSLNHAERERVKENKLKAALSDKQFRIYKRQLNETLRKVCICFFTLSGIQRTAGALTDQLRNHKAAIRDETGDLVMKVEDFRVALILYGVQVSERDYSLLETHFDTNNNQYVSIGDFGVRLHQQDSRKHGTVVTVCDTETQEQAPTAHPRWAKKVIKSLVEENSKTWIPYESEAQDYRMYWYCPETTERRWTCPPGAQHPDGRVYIQSSTLAGNKRIDQLLQSSVSRDIFEELCKCVQEAQRCVQEHIGSVVGQDQSVSALCLQQLGLETVPNFLSSIGDVRVAFLDHNRLDELPMTLGSPNSRLAHLHLSNNPRLVSLPVTIGNFVYLMSLTCAHGQLKSIDPAIGKLRSLRLLDLRDNKLVRLPSTIGKLTELRKLIVSQNQIDTLPRSLFTELGQLRHLDISHNLIAKLPDQMAEMRALLQLDLRYNSLRHIPVVIAKLISLKVFRIDGNHIEQVPTNVVSALTELICFTMEHNQSTCTLHTMREFTAQNMQQMHLAHNHISHLALHVDVCNAAQLIELKVHNNHISFLPQNMEHFTSLRVLWIHNNRIDELPHRLPSELRELRASANRITRVYTSIRKAKKLEHLDLARNQLTSLPLVIHEMTALVSLRVDGNPFKDKFAQILQYGAFQTNEDASMGFVYRKLIDGLKHDDIHILIDRYMGINIEKALTQHRDRRMARKRAPTMPTQSSKGLQKLPLSDGRQEHDIPGIWPDRAKAEHVFDDASRTTIRRRSKSSPEILLEECFERFSLCPGVITRKSFKRCVRLIGRLLTVQEVQRLCEYVFVTCDSDHTGELYYLEFTSSIFEGGHIIGGVKRNKLKQTSGKIQSDNNNNNNSNNNSNFINNNDSVSVAQDHSNHTIRGGSKDTTTPETSALEHDDGEYTQLWGVSKPENLTVTSNSSTSNNLPNCMEVRGNFHSRIVANAVKAYCTEVLTVRRSDSAMGPQPTSGAAFAQKLEQQLEADKDQVSKLEDLIRVQKDKAGEMRKNIRAAHGKASRVVRRTQKFVRGRLTKTKTNERGAAGGEKKFRYGKRKDVAGDKENDNEDAESGDDVDATEEREQEAKFFRNRKKAAREVLRAEKARVALLDKDLHKLKRVVTHSRCVSSSAVLEDVALKSQARIEQTFLEDNNVYGMRKKPPNKSKRRAENSLRGKNEPFTPDVELVRRLHLLFDEVAAASWSPEQASDVTTLEQQGAGSSTGEDGNKSSIKKSSIANGGEEGIKGKARIAMGELLLVMVKFYKEFGQGRTGMAPAKWREHLLRSVNRCFQGGYEDSKGDMVAFVLDAPAGMTRNEFVAYVLHTEVKLLEANGFQVRHMTQDEKDALERQREAANKAKGQDERLQDSDQDEDREHDQSESEDVDDIYGCGSNGVESRVQSHRVASKPEQSRQVEYTDKMDVGSVHCLGIHVLVDIFGQESSNEPVVVQMGSLSITVAELKAKLQFQVGIPADTQHLIFKAQRLHDSDTLTNLQVTNGDRIRLLVAQSTSWRP